jgi:MFS family permease
MNVDQFSYWYISIFLITLGVAGLIAGRYLGSIKCNFWLELRDPIIGPRLRAVLERRNELEGLGRKPVVIASISYLFFGVLCLLHIVTPAIAYALACADVALMSAWVYARVRNRSQRRAASLAPRRQSSVVPPLAFVGALLAGALPLLFVSDPNLRVAALLVALSSFAIVVSGWSIAGMAAVLVGDDPDLEVYVDERLRRSRVCSLLALAYAVIPVFIAVVTRDAENLPVYNYAFVVSMVLCVMYVTWFFIDFMQRRTPRPDGT